MIEIMVLLTTNILDISLEENIHCKIHYDGENRRIKAKTETDKHIP